MSIGAVNYGDLGAIRRWIGQADTPPQPPVSMGVDEPEPEVVEITPAELKAALAQPDPPLVLDVREPYEWRQVRMPGARHIPMNKVPSQVDDLPSDRRIVVMCAHGSRSYGMAAWLTEHGHPAVSLAGGLTQWAIQGGPVEQGAPRWRHPSGARDGSRRSAPAARLVSPPSDGTRALR